MGEPGAGRPKYLLLSYDRQGEFEGEEGYEETWALCEDAADLFADPSPPTRDTYELLRAGRGGNGPGGYFGWGFDALSDCLIGRWGAAPPVTLVWHDAAVARACPGVTSQVDDRPPLFEELLAFLAERRVAVRLD